MNTDALIRTKELFLAAAALPAADRDDYLRAECGGDGDLLTRVERLLARDPVAERILRPPEIDGVTVREHLQAERPDDRVGDFKLIEELGRGGMGVVWLAEQQSLRRQVALKLIRPGYATEGLLRRFRHEATILGRLEHPGIAHVYEVGTAPVGPTALAAEQPYFAMELVHGLPIDEYARQRDVDTRGRLELIARICDAIDHAHQKGVVHRDLKPDNILVTASGQPKILDFGIARVTESDRMTVTMHSVAGQVIGTLPYMSPEQVLGDPFRIDARSDVYSIGAVMFELLSGRLPVDVQGRSIAEAARIIRDDEPTRLGSIATALRGDVDTIVRKAIEKDRERRYQSAAELAADIRRYLADEPIVARPATTLYQVRKFMRRHKGLVAATALLFLTLLGGVIGTTIGLIEAHAESARARDESMRARRVTAFLSRTLGGANPDVAQEPGVTIRKLLDRAVSDTPAEQSIASAFADDPTGEADVRAAIGLAYFGLGEPVAARRQLLRAYHLRRSRATPESIHEVLAPLIQTEWDVPTPAAGHGHRGRHLLEISTGLLARTAPDANEALRGITAVGAKRFDDSLTRLQDLRGSSMPGLDAFSRRLCAERLLLEGRRRIRSSLARTFEPDPVTIPLGQGCRLLRESLAWNPDSATHSSKVRTQSELFRGLYALRRLDEATRLAQTAHDALVERLATGELAEGHWYVALQRARIGASLASGDPRAERILVSEFEPVRTTGWSPYAAEVASYRATHFERTGRPDQARRCRDELAVLLLEQPGRPVYAEILDTLGPEHGELRAALRDYWSLWNNPRPAAETAAEHLRRARGPFDRLRDACVELEIDADPRGGLLATMLSRWTGDHLWKSWLGSRAPYSPGHDRLLTEAFELARDLGRDHAHRFRNSYAHVLMLLAQHYCRTRRYVDGLATIDLAIESVGERDHVEHDYQAYQATRTMALVGLRRFDEVIASREHLRRQVELVGPLNTMSRFGLTMLLIAAARTGRHGEIESDLRVLLEEALASGNRAMLWDSVWMVTLMPGFAPYVYELAVRVAEQAGPGRSADWRAPYARHEVLGRALFRAGQPERALAELAKTARAGDDPETTGSIGFRALALAAVGRRDEAESALREFRRITPALWERAEMIKDLLEAEIERALR